MNKAWELNQKIEECLRTYTTEKVEPYFEHLNIGDGRDVEYYRETHSEEEHPKGIYRYLACAVKVLKPKIVVELGADRGASALVMESELPKNGKIYSIDQRDGWEYVPKKSKIVKLLGDSIDTYLLKDINLNNVDLWFIDSEHNEDTVRLEYATYSPYWHKGTVIMFDDIDLYYPVWLDIPFDKYESKEIHGQNFGVIKV